MDFCIEDPSPWLVLANRYYIRNLTADGSYMSLVAKGFENVVSLDYDLQEQMLYFADVGKQRVVRLKYTDADPNAAPNTEVVLRHNVFGIEGITVDWIGR